MSEIKKALEKAKAERGKSLEVTRPSEPASDRIGLTVERPTFRVQPEEGTDVSPVYSETRSITCDRERLIDNKIFSIQVKDEVADQYKLLRTMVLNRTRPKGHNTIAVSSFREGDGKSVTATNLAITLAYEPRQNVLLVDTDLRRPSIHQIFGIDPSPGLIDCLLHDKSIKDALINPGIERFTVLPSGGKVDNSSELLGSHRFENLISEIKNRYPDRYIVFDTPALNLCSDALVLSSYLDTMLLVARSGYTSAEEIKSGMEMMNGKDILGIVLNDSPIQRGWAY